MIRGGAGAALVIVVLMFVSGAAGRWFDLDHPVLEAHVASDVRAPTVLVLRYLLRPPGLVSRGPRVSRGSRGGAPPRARGVARWRRGLVVTTR